MPGLMRVIPPHPDVGCLMWSNILRRTGHRVDPWSGAIFLGRPGLAGPVAAPQGPDRLDSGSQIRNSLREPDRSIRSTPSTRVGHSSRSSSPSTGSPRRSPRSPNGPSEGPRPVTSTISTSWQTLERPHRFADRDVPRPRHRLPEGLVAVVPGTVDRPYPKAGSGTVLRSSTTASRHGSPGRSSGP